MDIELRMTPKVLVVDDEQDMCDVLQSVLERKGYAVSSVTSAFSALDLVGREDFAVVLTDLGMAEMNGLALCERILGVRPDMPVIVVTGQANMESAISCLRAGAYDFVTKPVAPEILAHSVARALEHRQMHDELKRLRSLRADKARHVDLVGASAAMRRMYELIARVAESDASVLIQGETGTGKELVARAIHASSRRKAGPFVALSCAAVPPALLESELFGHARGAFTDAKSQRTGLFRQAHGGTLLLDEIGELPLEMQPKLLRALQERAVRPVGADTEVPFDVRVISATNRDLEYDVFHKRFREDLFYRINVVKIDLPPLRDRGGDAVLLARHFLGRFGAAAEKGTLELSASAAEKILAYKWPGNVRELENCMERAVAFARFDQVTIEDLPEKIRAYRADRFVVSADDPTEVLTIEELERRYIFRVLSLVGGNKSQAAQMLGLDRRTLYRKLERYEDLSGPTPGARAALPVAPGSWEPDGRAP
jgi:DNA-binding NtrC family response regulator